MKQAYIWDLDGTLFDSYGVIVESAYEACKSLGYELDRRAIHKYVIVYSVTDLLQLMAEKTGLPLRDFKAAYSAVSRAKTAEITAMPHAVELLSRLNACGCENYVYTHRGKTTDELLTRLQMKGFFKEILTAENRFPRKPAPDALLDLMARYGLNSAQTCYVGDRTLDMDCAKNAGICGILYLPAGSCCDPNGSETVIVRDLLEIADL